MKGRNVIVALNRSPIVIVGLILLIILVSALLLTLFLSQQSQQIRQRAAGHVVYATPGDNLSDKANSLSAGDTLILHDGLYSKSRLGIAGIHGTSTSPITIRAEHDGKAVLDGGGPHVIEITNSFYVLVEGLVAQNPAQGGVVDVEGSDHITLRRVSASNANPGNNHVFYIANGTTNTLIEDCAGYGRGRYIFIAYHANHITFRRTWAHWTDQEQFDAPRAAYSIYGSSDVTLENVIGFNAFPKQPDPANNAYTAVYETSDGPPTDQVKYIGDMFYNNWDGLYLNAASGQNTQIIDSYFESPSTLSQTGYSDNEHGNGLAWWNGNGGSITNSTFVNNEVGFNRANGASSPMLTNSVFLNNGTAIARDRGHSYLDLFGNGINGTSLNSTDKQVDPGYNVAKYGRGAYFFLPPNSPLKHAGQGGADIGATIMYRSVDGVLTKQPLWPWPMEDRIKAETGHSVTWESGGGFWKTLDGVYSNTRGLVMIADRSLSTLQLARPWRSTFLSFSPVLCFFSYQARRKKPYHTLRPPHQQRQALSSEVQGVMGSSACELLLARIRLISIR